MNEIPPIRFESDRLIFRRAEPGDGVALNAAIVESFDVLSQWMAWADHIPSVEESEEKVLASRERFDAKHEFQFLLFDKASGLLAGSCGLHYWSEQYQCFEIGYWIRKSFLRQGFASEACQRMTQFAFEEGLCGLIEIHVAADNLVSQKVALRCGYAYDRTITASMRTLSNDLPVDEIVFAKRK